MNNKTKEKRAGFTQGPWIVKPGKNYYHIHGAQEVALVENWMNETPKANARLIASAPELYEQCKLFERVLTELVEMGEADISERDKLREVLAKAAGGAEG